MNLALILLKTEPAHPLFDAVQKVLAKFFWIVYDKIWKINKLRAYLMQKGQISENLRVIQ